MKNCSLTKSNFYIELYTECIQSCINTIWYFFLNILTHILFQARKILFSSLMMSFLLNMKHFTCNHNVLSCRSTLDLKNRVFLALPLSHDDWFNVFQMEEDRLLPGNIMFSKGGTQLYTTDRTYSNIILNLTDPVKEVFYAKHFTQILKNEVVLVDTLNNCLKMLDRTNNLFNEFAGVCNCWLKGIPHNGSDPIFDYAILIKQDNHNPSLLYIVEDYIVKMFNISQSFLVTTLIPNADYRIYRGSGACFKPPNTRTFWGWKPQPRTVLGLDFVLGLRGLFGGCLTNCWLCERSNGIVEFQNVTFTNSHVFVCPTRALPIPHV